MTKGQTVLIRRTIRTTLTVATLVVTTAVATRDGAAASPAPAATSSPSPLTLVTGQVISVTAGPDGRPQVAAHQSPDERGRPTAYQTYTKGTDLIVIPDVAQPFVPGLLDSSLFDVNRLQATATTGLPVRITYRPGAAHTTVPGVTVSGTSGDTVTGVITSKSAAQFGAALARQPARSANAPAAVSGPFAGISKITADLTPRVVQPNYAMRTLTIDIIGVDGTPAIFSARLLLWNVDDVTRYQLDRSFGGVGGTQKVSVPAGHYSGVLMVDVPVWQGYNIVAEHDLFISAPQINVGQNASVTFDARTATQPVTVDTPRPVGGSTVERFVFARTDAKGVTRSFGLVASAPYAPGYYSVWVAPTKRAPKVGQLHWFYSAELVPPADVTQPNAVPYTYNVGFTGDGTIPADQRHVLHARDLARLTTAYDAERENQVSGWMERPNVPGFLVPIFGVYEPLYTPAVRTEYFTTDPRVRWQGSYLADYASSWGGQEESAWRPFAPGETQRQTWFRQPLHPGLGPSHYPVGQLGCPMCISPDRGLYLWLPGFGDNDPNHANTNGDQQGYRQSFSYGVYADDVPVATGSAATVLNTTVAMPAAAQTYRIDYDMTRAGPGLLLSNDVRTEWQIPARDRTGSLPDGWACRQYPDDTSRDCSVLPALTNLYHLPVDSLGTIEVGKAHGTISLSHLSNVPNLAMKKVQVQVSFTGGDQWVAATVADQGDGTYGVTFTVPDASTTDGYGAIRLVAADIGGSRLTQTIQHAFAIKGA